MVEEVKKAEAKAEAKPVVKQPTLEEFRAVFTTGFMKGCPMFCLHLGCPYVNECWDIKPMPVEPEKKSDA